MGTLKFQKGYTMGWAGQGLESTCENGNYSQRNYWDVGNADSPDTSEFENYECPQVPYHIQIEYGPSRESFFRGKVAACSIQEALERIEPYRELPVQASKHGGIEEFDPDYIQQEGDMRIIGDYVYFTTEGNINSEFLSEHFWLD